MMNTEFLSSNPMIQLTLALRLGMIQKEALPNLSEDQFLLAIKEIKWKSGMPSKIHEITHDVFACTADEIVSVLAKRAIIDARKNSLEAYASYFGEK
jgi:hypothetical protein